MTARNEGCWLGALPTASEGLALSPAQHSCDRGEVKPSGGSDLAPEISPCRQLAVSRVSQEVQELL